MHAVCLNRVTHELLVVPEGPLVTCALPAPVALHGLVAVSKLDALELHAVIPVAEALGGVDLGEERECLHFIRYGHLAGGVNDLN